MAEAEGIGVIGGAENFKVNTLEKREDRKRKAEPKNLETALARLRDRTSEPFSLRDGKSLIHAEMQDLQAKQEPGDAESNQVFFLRTLDTSLTKIADGDIKNVTVGAAREIRSYFGDKIKQWDIVPNKDALPDAEQNRDIYNSIITDVVRHIPTAEAVLPEYPTFTGKNLEPVLNLISDSGELTDDDAEKAYAKFAETVTETKKRSTAANPQWVNHKTALTSALKEWEGVKVDELKPLLVTIKNGETTTKVIDIEQNLPAHVDGVTQFVLDPIYDMPYLSGIFELDNMDAIAPFGIEAIKKIQETQPVLSEADVDGLRLFVGLLERSLKDGTVQKKNKNQLTKLYDFVKNKIETTPLKMEKKPGTEENKNENGSENNSGTKDKDSVDLVA